MKRTQIAFILILSALCSCGVQHHQKQIKKHSEKLKSKGVIIPKDTVKITKSDTIRTTFTRNDTIYTVLRVVDTVTLEPTVEVKTRWQTKYETRFKYKTVKVENRAMIDSLKQVLKLERQETKQVKAENRRSNWWIFLIIGLVVGYLLNIFTNLRGIFKNLNRNYE